MVGRSLQTVRKLVRFILACSLWLHALFVIGLRTPNLSGVATHLHLTAGETVIFALLLVLSCLSSYGLWRLVVDGLYIYFFPFVLLFFCIKWTYRALAKINRLFLESSRVQGPPIKFPSIQLIPAPSVTAEAKPTEAAPITWRTAILVALRPLRRFTSLWCILLLLTPHLGLLKFALAVVLVHIVFSLIAVLRITVFSTGLISKMESHIRNSTESLISKLGCVTKETEATPDLRNTWTTLTGIRATLLILQNRHLVSKWAALLGSVFMAFVYVYLALLFSFAYYGIARVQSMTFSWSDAFVTSLFIPFAFGDLPRNVWLKFAGGMHCTMIVTVGAGTVINYLARRARDLQNIANGLSSRFADHEVTSRLLILEEKFKPIPAVSASTDGKIA